MKADPQGPTLLQNHHLREKISHFDHERIQERAVHARGAATHGVFVANGAGEGICQAGFLRDGSVGDAHDNGLMESINGLYKTECIRTTVFHPGPYKTLADVEYATAGWVDWYNHARLHSSLGMVTPIEHERAHYAAHNPVGSIT